MNSENTDLKSSINVLLVLFIMIEQNLEALIYYEDNIQEASIDRSVTSFAEKHEVIDFAITESLWFRIITLSCSFLDEWDRILAVKYEIEYRRKLLLIKKVLKPARRAISYWKDLKGMFNG